ncbi:MAG TPA: hypothetical protein VGK46_01810 [Saprospiraceae bacterium]
MLVKRLRFSLAFFAIGLSVSANAQANLGQACGCPPVATRPTVNMSLKADANGLLIANNTVLSCDTLYILNDKIYVTNGKSITIAPGTAIKAPFVGGGSSDQNALIVARGGKIFAPGTRECPIVFTSTDDPLNGSYGINNRGKWGGVVLLGRAKNNLKAGTGGLSTATDGVGFIEGFPAATPENLHGMPLGTADDNDNSGIMTFVSIRHGGAVVAPANELNGLTLGSVGRGTTLQHIEVVANADDGIEFFGGTVNLKYASIMFNDDDGIDYDLGYNGKCQFLCVVKTDSITSPGGDNGFEADGMDNNVGTFGGSPKLYNATMIGFKSINGTTAVDQNQGIEFKEAVRGEIKNCIFSNYNRGVQFANTATWTLDADGSGGGAPVPYDDAYAAWNAGTLILQNNTFIGTTQAVRVAGANGSGPDYTKFNADGNTAIASVAGFSGLHNMNVSTNAVTTKHDLIPGADITSTSLPPVDGFFTPANYRGAFKAGEKSWLYDYSVRALIGLEGALLSCPTDINTDGSTTTADFLLLLGEFNTTCE